MDRTSQSNLEGFSGRGRRKMSSRSFDNLSVFARSDGSGHMTTEPLSDTGDLDVEVLVANATSCLNRHQLEEAKSWYNHALTSIGNQIHGQEKLYVQALSGLAEVHRKRSRSCRNDDLEWYYQMMQSIALQYDVFCSSEELEANCEFMEEKEKRNWYWVEDFHKKSAQQLQVTDKLLFESLQDKLIVHQSEKVEDEIQDSSCINIAWLKKLVDHIEYRTMHSRERGRSMSVADLPSGELPSVLPEGNGDNSSNENKPMDKIPKVDCVRVQRAIQKLVRQISSDMRQRYVRKKLPEEMFRKNVSGEMIAQFAPMSETRDVLTLFENAIIQYKYGMDPDEFREWEMDTSDVESDCTTKYTGSTDLNSDDQNDLNESPTDEYWDGNPCVDIPSEDKYKLSGVLTVWRAHKDNHQVRKNIKPYLLQGFEELSPLTEANLTSCEHSNSQVFSSDNSPTGSNDNSLGLMSVPSMTECYLSKHKIKYALALTLAKCAGVLQKGTQNMKHATELYKYALGILQEKSPDIKQKKNLTALIYRNIGMIRCSQGNLSIGSQLMHESMELYSVNDNVENINIAEVWYELANAHMRDQWEENSISRHIMKLVKDQLDRQIGSENDTDGPADDASVSSDNDDEGEEYHVCAYEAMGCYKSALSILSKLRKRKEVHTGLYVDVLTRLGDCSIVVGQYERAVLCFEEALYLCQNTFGSVSLTNSAHILSMLGTTNFLLGIYSKAATMFETAHILQQHLYGLEDNFEMAFTLTMQGITYFEMGCHHKCIAMCMKAYTLYTNIYKEEIMHVEPLSRWFITQTLYYLGYVYSTLNFNDKALHYLELASNMMDKANLDDRDIRQEVKILKVMADIYANLDMNSTALEYYQQALDKSLLLGNEQSATALQNQLLNRMAGVHVCTKDYGVAANYLEQALDCQRNVETSIKGDLMGILHQLGNTYTLSGDLERAIDCYNECREAYEEADVTTGPDISNTYACLGTLFHVKGCMQDDNDEMMEYLQSSDQYYQNAVEMNPDSSACVQYANFLYQQEQYAEAVLAMLPFVFLFHPPEQSEIFYNGPEQAVLPEHLLYDLNDIDEVHLDVNVFARYVGILCLKHLNLMKDAEDCLVGLVHIVYHSHIALNHIMLGYSFLEMELYPEAAEAFETASLIQNDEMSEVNKWISLCLWSYMVMTKGLTNLWVDLTEAYFNLNSPTSSPAFTMPSLVHSLQPLRDSGYYDQGDVQNTRTYVTGELSQQDELTVQQETYDDWHIEEEVTETPAYLMEPILTDKHVRLMNASYDVDFSLSKSPNVQSPEDEWVIEEEVTLETPSVILAALTNRGDYSRPGHNRDASLYSDQSPSKEQHWIGDREYNMFGLGSANSTTQSRDSIQTYQLQDNLNANQAYSKNDTNGNGTISTTHQTQWSGSRFDTLNANQSSVAEEVVEEGWDSWVVTEEVVDTPAELLEAIASNNNR